MVTEHDASRELEIARKAVEAARDQEREFVLNARPTTDAIAQTQEAIDRTVALFQASSEMRGAIQEALLAGRGPDELEATIGFMIQEVGERSLKIAAGFESHQHWTLSIYKAEYHEEKKRMGLRCCAAIRSVQCDNKEARIWWEGVGVGGVAYATGEEHTVVSATDEELDQFKAVDLWRDHDRERYRSMVAVPIYPETKKGRDRGALSLRRATGQTILKTSGIRGSADRIARERLQIW